MKAEELNKIGFEAQSLANEREMQHISQSKYRESIKVLVEQYANQRVIEELEFVEQYLFLNGKIDTKKVLNERIKTLKQN